MSAASKRVRKCIVRGCEHVQGGEGVRFHSLKSDAGAGYLALLQSKGTPFSVPEFKKSHLICNQHSKEKRQRLSKIAVISIDETELIKNSISAHSPTKRRPPRQRFLIPSKPRDRFIPVPIPTGSACLDLNSAIPQGEMDQLQSLQAELQKKEDELRAAREIHQKEIDDLKRQFNAELQQIRHDLLHYEPASVAKFVCDFSQQEHRVKWTGFQNLENLFLSTRDHLILSPRLMTSIEERCGLQGVFFHFLIWLKHGGLRLSDFPRLGADRTVSHYFKAITEALVPWAHQQVKLPQIEEWAFRDNSLATSRYSHATCNETYPNKRFLVVDGSYTRVLVPETDSVERMLLYHSKHKVHAFGWFIVCTIDGRIVYVSNCYEGSISDKESWEKSDVRAQLNNQYPATSFTETGRDMGPIWSPFRPSIAADKAYPRISLPNSAWCIHTTKTSASEADLNDPKRFIDPRISVHRAVVERAIGKIKRFGILNNRAFVSCQTMEFMSNLLLVICALSNWLNFVDRGKRYI